jgi:hypothetical protein
VYVAVEPLPDGAKLLRLTAENIQTDVELTLRLAGIRPVTKEERLKIPASPYIYVKVIVSSDAKAASVEVELNQNALLERNGDFAPGVTTWEMGGLITNPSARFARNGLKDLFDQFLNAWLSVNPKK